MLFRSCGADARPDAATAVSAGTAPANTVSATVSATETTAARASDDHTVSKVLVVMVENHSLSQMRRGMPWLFRLAQRYGYATGYRAVTHPSLPNYLAIAGGSTFGVSDDDSPSAHPLRGASVFGQAIAQGGTARLYADAMSGTCALEPDYPYAVKHNPWAYFTAERDSCRSDDVPLSQLADDARSGDLPDVGMLIPDLQHDAHDGTLRAADRWLRTQLAPVLAGSDFTGGDLALVVTADEDDHNQGNKVLTVVAQPSIRSEEHTSELQSH